MFAFISSVDSSYSSGGVMTFRRLNARGRSQVHFDDFSGEAFFCFTIRCASEIT